MKKFADFIDSYGLISRIEYGKISGGDSLSYLGLAHLLGFLNLIHFKNIYKKHFSQFNQREEYLLPVRHISPSHPNWHSNYFTSRDQLVTVLAAVTRTQDEEMVKEARRIFKVIAKNYFVFPNNARFIDGEIKIGAKTPDIMKLEYLGTFIRAAKMWYLYPLLLITDFSGIFNSMFKVVYAFINPSHTDDQSRIAVLLAAKNYLPTLFSYISRKIYNLRPAWTYNEFYYINETFWYLDKARRKQVLTNFKYDRKGFGPQYAMDARFGERDPGQPPFNQVDYRSLLK